MPLLHKSGTAALLLLILASFNSVVACTRNPSGSSASQNTSSSSNLEQKVATASLSNAPADPGEAGKKSLEGIDSNGNGVRDDLERWIKFRFPESPRKQAALTQFAKAYQRALVAAGDGSDSSNLVGFPMVMMSPDPSNPNSRQETVVGKNPSKNLEEKRKQSSLEASRELLEAQECVYAVVRNPGSLEVPYLDELRALIRNTPERAAAALKGDQDYSGQTYTLAGSREEKLKKCHFDVQSLQDK